MNSRQSIDSCTALPTYPTITLKISLHAYRCSVLLTQVKDYLLKDHRDNVTNKNMQYWYLTRIRMIQRLLDTRCLFAFPLKDIKVIFVHHIFSKGVNMKIFGYFLISVWLQHDTPVKMKVRAKELQIVQKGKHWEPLTVSASHHGGISQRTLQ